MNAVYKLFDACQRIAFIILGDLHVSKANLWKYVNTQVSRKSQQIGLTASLK